MRAITLWRPWADAFLHAGKRIENRNEAWNIDAWIDPRVCFHSGKKFDAERMPLIQRACIRNGKAVLTGEPSVYPEGVLAFTGVVLAAIAVDEARAEVAAGNPFYVEQEPWIIGPWCMVISEIIPFVRPIPAKGKQGWFHVDYALVAYGQGFSENDPRNA